MGGVTEFARVVALASTRGVSVVPHGSGPFGYFMAMAFPSVPMAEFLVMSENADALVPNFGDMFVEEPMPVDGYVTLPSDRPGWGLEFNKKALGLVRPFPHGVDRPLGKGDSPRCSQPHPASIEGSGVPGVAARAAKSGGAATVGGTRPSWKLLAGVLSLTSLLFAAVRAPRVPRAFAAYRFNGPVVLWTSLFTKLAG